MLDEKKNTPAVHVFRHRELAQKIATLTEDIEKLKSEKVLMLNQFNCADNHGMDKIKQHIASMESSLETLNQQEENILLNWMRHWRSTLSCNNRQRIWMPWNWRLPVTLFGLIRSEKQFKAFRPLIGRILILTC